jgi:hypothetical protein
MPLHPTSRALAAAFVLCAAASSSSAQSITVDATSVVRVVDDKVFGINTPFWDGTFTNAQSGSYLTQMDTRFMRFGGGSASDNYNWQTNQDVSGTTWPFNVDQFEAVAQAHHAQAIITTNYGTGTAAEAAAYLQYTNVTHSYGFKYWEIGNECYGTWEADTTANPHDAYTYATRAVAYIQAMRAVDPTAKIGAVIPLGEDSYSNGYSAHPATNPRTSVAHNGWGLSSRSASTPISSSTTATSRMPARRTTRFCCRTR